MKTPELEQTAAIRILFYLMENKEAKMTELMRQLKVSQHPVYTSLKVLAELQLIKEDITPYPLRRVFSLTEKGLRVAVKLAEIEGILGEREEEKKS